MRTDIIIAAGDDIIVGQVLDVIEGPGGPMGAKGPAGTSYEHLQPSASAEWIINHNLGVRPSITVLSPGGVELLADVVHLTANQARVYLAAPMSGSAHCV